VCGVVLITRSKNAYDGRRILSLIIIDSGCGKSNSIVDTVHTVAHGERLNDTIRVVNCCHFDLLASFRIPNKPISITHRVADPNIVVVSSSAGIDRRVLLKNNFGNLWGYWCLQIILCVKRLSFWHLILIICRV